MKYFISITFLIFSAQAMAGVITSGVPFEYTQQDTSIEYEDEVVQAPVKIHKPKSRRNTGMRDIGNGVGFGEAPKKPVASQNPIFSDKTHGKKGRCRNTNGHEMRKMLSLVNRFRSRNGRSALKLSMKCNKLATLIGKKNTSRQRLLHYSEYYNSSQVNNIMSKVGIRQWGENIAMGSPSVMCAAEQAVREWIDSSGHRENLLHNYTHMGIHRGVAKNGMVYWTQCFH